MSLNITTEQSAAIAYSIQQESHPDSKFGTVMIISCLGFFLCCVTLSLHLGLANWGTMEHGTRPFSNHKRRLDIPIVCVHVCLAYCCLCNIVNASIWHSEMWMYGFNGTVWCDIDTRLQVFFSCGLLTSVTALVRNLSLTVSAKSSATYFESKRKPWVDLAICVTFPCVQLCLLPLIQYARFSVVQTFGCSMLFTYGWPKLVVYQIWPCLWAAAASVYAIICIYYVFLRRREFKAVLLCTGSGLSVLQFSQLLVFNILTIVCMATYTFYTFILQAAHTERKYDLASLRATRFTIIFLPYGTSIYVFRWLFCALAILAFCLLGMGADSRMTYMKICDTIGIGFLVRSFGRFLVKVWMIIVPQWAMKKWKIRQEKKSKTVLPSYLYRQASPDINLKSSTDHYQNSSDSYNYDKNSYNSTYYGNNGNGNGNNYLAGNITCDKDRNNEGLKHQIPYIDTSAAEEGHFTSHLEHFGVATPTSIQYSHNAYNDLFNPQQHSSLTGTHFYSLGQVAQPQPVYSPTDTFPSKAYSSTTHSPDSAVTEFDKDWISSLASVRSVESSRSLNSTSESVESGRTHISHGQVWTYGERK